MSLKRSHKFKSEYWSRYYDYLLKKPSWSITAVKNIDSSTDEIMNALTNPRKGTAGERMGMDVRLCPIWQDGALYRHDQ